MLSATFATALAPKPPQAKISPEATAAPVLACSVDEVTSLVDDWAGAWRKKDTVKFMKFYSDKFTPYPPQLRADWEKEKIKSISTKSKIVLKLKDVKVQCDGDKANVKFSQDYQLVTFKFKKAAKNPECAVCNMQRIPVVNYTSNVSKELQFERDGSQWKIVKELINK